MSEKPESEEFEDEEPDESAAGESDVDLDQVTKELDLAKRRQAKGGDPAWRRLERLLEDKRTAELTSDFDDYDIDIADEDDDSVTSDEDEGEDEIDSHAQAEDEELQSEATSETGLRKEFHRT